MSALRTGIPWAGLPAGPTAWAISTQANYALAPWSCSHGGYVVLLLGLVLAMIALVGAGLSLLAWRHRSVEASGSLESDGRPRYLLASMSALLALLFAILILVQTSAGLVLSGCEQ